MRQADELEQACFSRYFPSGEKRRRVGKRFHAGFPFGIILRAISHKNLKM